MNGAVWREDHDVLPGSFAHDLESASAGETGCRQGNGGGIAVVVERSVV